MKARLAILLCLTAFTGTLLSCGSKEEKIEKAFEQCAGKYLLFITKKDFTLEVYDRGLERIARYRIGYGKNPDRKPKLHEGDNRTPEGTYFVNEILSMDAAPSSSSYRKLAAMNRVYFSAKQGHHRYGKPDTDLGDNVYGPRYFGIDYPNKEDRNRYRRLAEKGEIPRGNSGSVTGIGYGIAIHGNNDEGSIGHLCSSGCVRMYNRDIVELDRFVHIGTPVIIAPD